MIQFIIGFVSLLRLVLIDLPRRLLTLFALAWLGLILWLHRKRHSRSGVTGAEAASALLAGRKLKTRVLAVENLLADCYLPKQDAIVLSERTFHGTSIGAISVAAHEVGHAIQRKRWCIPWCARGLLVLPANLGLTLCLWVWLAGMMLKDQRVVLAGIACFTLYLLFLLFELVCEMDASRRAVHELVRCGLLDHDESRIARRILRSALATYLAAFIGAMAALACFLGSIDWSALLAHFPLVSEQVHSILSQG